MNKINVKILTVVVGIAIILTVFTLALTPSIGMSFYQGYQNQYVSAYTQSSLRNQKIGEYMMGSTMGGMMREGYSGACGPSMSGMHISGMVMMGNPYYPSAKPIGMEAAVKIAEEYLLALKDANLEIDEVEEYSNNYYVSIKEKDTSRGAIELMIDRFYGNIHPEPQSMMWNQRYGMMGFYNISTISMSITPEEALKIAQSYLDIAYPGTKVGSITTYYGYYTIMTTLNGEHYGMLSVNGYTGQVWYHTWHGMFLGELED